MSMGYENFSLSISVMELFLNSHGSTRYHGMQVENCCSSQWRIILTLSICWKGVSGLVECCMSWQMSCHHTDAMSPHRSMSPHRCHIHKVMLFKDPTKGIQQYCKHTRHWLHGLLIYRLCGYSHQFIIITNKQNWILTCHFISFFSVNL